MRLPAVIFFAVLAVTKRPELNTMGLRDNVLGSKGVMALDSLFGDNFGWIIVILLVFLLMPKHQPQEACCDAQSCNTPPVPACEEEKPCCVFYRDKKRDFRKCLEY